MESLNLVFRKDGVVQPKISRALIGIFSGATISADGTSVDFYSCAYPALKDIICDSKASANLDPNEVLIKKVY